MQWFDAGLNLFSPQFSGQEQQIVQQAHAENVTHLLLISSDLNETELNKEFASKHPRCFCTAGVHPHHAARVSSHWLKDLTAALQHPAVVAIGECGLDFNRDFSPRTQQQVVFAAQLQLAKECGKAVYLHERDAFATQVAILKEHKISHGVAHCFTGNQQQMRTYLDLGLYIGITGWLCDERRGQALQDAIRYLPSDRLILESDAPYLLPRTLRPRPRFNQPAFLPVIAADVARLTGRTLQDIAIQSMNNSLALFQIKEH